MLCILEQSEVSSLCTQRPSRQLRGHSTCRYQHAAHSYALFCHNNVPLCTLIHICVQLSVLLVNGGDCLDIQMLNSHTNSHSLPSSPSIPMSPIYPASSAPPLSSSFSPCPSPLPFTIGEQSNRPNMVRSAFVQHC